MKILGGTYLFGESISPTVSDINESVKFVSANTEYTGMRFSGGMVDLYYRNDAGSTLAYIGVDAEPGWRDQAYRTVTFESQIVTDDFYNWFTENAEAVEELYTIKRSTLKDIADSIREKKEKVEIIPVSEFPVAIKSIDTTHKDKLKSIIDRSITAINIPEGTKSIGAHAFNSCSSLESVTIPNGVTTLSFSCFYACSSLKEIILPDSVTTLEQTAFAAARSLERAYLGSGVSTIWGNVFQNCYALKTLVCSAETPPTLQSNSLQGVPEDCVICVPEGSVDAYKAATNWSDRADYIVGGRFIHGTYRFNDGVNAEGSVIEQDVNFTTNGTAFTRMTFNPGMMELYYGSENVYVGYGDGWSNEAYKTVTFGGGTVSEDFYAFVKSNAVEVTE